MKKAMIFGDSYSTFEGYIPDGYAIYYSKIPRVEGIDVTEVTQCWWHMLMSEMGVELVMNDSWSGSTICYTGYQGDCSATSSFITRLEKYIAEREHRHDFENRIRRLAGIGKRALTQREARFFESWQKMELPFEVISFAYEISTNATGDFAPAHLNAVLESFKKAGVTSLEEAQKASAEKAEELKKVYGQKSTPAAKPEKKNDFVSFDSEDFFNAAKKRSMEKMKND